MGATDDFALFASLSSFSHFPVTMDRYSQRIYFEVHYCSPSIFGDYEDHVSYLFCAFCLLLWWIGPQRRSVLFSLVAVAALTLIGVPLGVVWWYLDPLGAVKGKCFYEWLYECSQKQEHVSGSSAAVGVLSPVSSAIVPPSSAVVPVLPSVPSVPVVPLTCAHVPVSSLPSEPQEPVVPFLPCAQVPSPSAIVPVSPSVPNEPVVPIATLPSVPQEPVVPASSSAFVPILTSAPLPVVRSSTSCSAAIGVLDGAVDELCKC